MRELKTRAEFYELRNEWGTQLHRYNGIEGSRSLRIVGPMPGSEHNYIILCDGEHTEHLYIGRDETAKDWKPKHRWFIGKYDSAFFGRMIIEDLQKRIKITEEVYMGQELVTAQSSHGEFSFDRETGEVYETRFLDFHTNELPALEISDNFLGKPIKVDMREYRMNYGNQFPIASSVDVLDIGYWYEYADQIHYCKPNQDWRDEHRPKANV